MRRYSVFLPVILLFLLNSPVTVIAQSAKSTATITITSEDIVEHSVDSVEETKESNSDTRISSSYQNISKKESTAKRKSANKLPSTGAITTHLFSWLGLFLLLIVLRTIKKRRGRFSLKK